MAATRKSTSTSPTSKFANSPEAYIAAAPKAAQPHLRQLRALIRELAPKAEERISYGIVGYFYPTRMIYFGGHAKHVALYPAGDAKGLQKYLYGASTLRFPLDEPLPVAKIKALVRSRVKEYESAAKRKRAAAAVRRHASARSKS
jgi:uncharacterized protein YdhG (YjbR/CyaY superfamily)